MSTAIQTSHLYPLSNSYKFNLNSQNNNIRSKNDLIAGNEFLSIYIENNNQSPVEIQLPRQQKFNRRLFEPSNNERSLFEEEETSDGVLPIEVMFTSESENTRLPLAYMFRQSQNSGGFERKEESDDSSEVYDDSEEAAGDAESFQFDKIVTKSKKSQSNSETNRKNADDSADSESSNNPIITQYDSQNPNPQQQQLDNFRTQRQQQHDLLFQSHSATVTLSGPSGPFKAIICHDCDRKNQDGQTVAHSVVF